MATGNPVRRERGFSLIELMVAMVATLIISGAVMQLVGAGKGAFRREPEISDRQQNIRMAMAMIQQDVQSAGLGLPPFTQVFTNGLNNLGPQVPDGAPRAPRRTSSRSSRRPPCPGVKVCLVPRDEHRRRGRPARRATRSRRSSASGTTAGTSRWASPTASATAGTRARATT